MNDSPEPSDHDEHLAAHEKARAESAWIHTRRACKTCKWHRRRSLWDFLTGRAEGGRCAHPEPDGVVFMAPAMVERIIDPESGSCGPRGRYWEFKQ